MRVLLPLLAFVAVVAARLPVLLSHLDTWYPFEVHCGTIAVALADGLDLDWPRLPIVSHVRGNVVNALLLRPVFALFGVSSLTLKLVPLAWHAGTVALLVHVLTRHAGRFAAFAAGVLLVLAPPAIQKLSVLGLASHLESTLFFVLALGAWLGLTARRHAGTGAFLAFGAAVGAGAFFHVQALLPCLVLVALLPVSEGWVLRPRALAALVAGIALLALPALAFEGGSLRIVFASVGGAADAAIAEGFERTAPADKLSRLLLEGAFVDSLEYGEVSGPAGRWLGRAAAASLLLLPLLAVALERRRLAGLWRRAFRGDGPPPGPVPPLALHAVLVVAAFSVSHVALHPRLGSGAAYRHFAPLLFSLLALSGLAVGALADRGRRRLAVSLLVAAALPGAAGLVAVAGGTPASRTAQRGECYEWFRDQLAHASGGDSPATVELIARVDRGDPRFRTLRFPIHLVRTPADDLHFLEKERCACEGLPRDVGLFALTHLGRLLAERSLGGPGAPALPPLHDPDLWRQVAAMDGPEAAALLHGAGLALKPPRLTRDPSRVEAHLEFLARLLGPLPAEHARTVAEGYGFSIGFVFDPYSKQARSLLALQERLPAELADAAFTGVGWGCRQRCLEPPPTVPAGLVELECVPAPWRPAFVRGYTGATLPAEAAVLGR
jgi:hypothetical protein